MRAKIGMGMHASAKLRLEFEPGSRRKTDSMGRARLSAARKGERQVSPDWVGKEEMRQLVGCEKEKKGRKRERWMGRAKRERKGERGNGKFLN